MSTRPGRLRGSLLGETKAPLRRRRVRSARLERANALVSSNEDAKAREDVDAQDTGLAKKAAGFKAERERNLRAAAVSAIEQVQRTGQPYRFQPMSSHERRMLHLAFRGIEDLETESSGEGLRRFVVVYPRGAQRVSAPRPTRNAHQRQ